MGRINEYFKLKKKLIYNLRFFFKSNKKLFLILLLIIFLFLLPNILWRFTSIVNYKNLLPQNFQTALRMLYQFDSSAKKISNDYNVKFLPETQFLDLRLEKINLDFLKFHKKGYNNINTGTYKSFYLELYDENIFILSHQGKIYTKKINQILNKEINFAEINSNLNIVRTLDIHINKNNIYVSSVNKESNNCYSLNLYKANINYNYLDFLSIFKSKECIAELIQSGKIQTLKLNEVDHILLATAADTQANNQNDIKPQSHESIFGKILLIDSKNNYSFFSKGFRNVLGLYADDDVVIATDNGPRGGDEINKVIYDKNYGWPISSYGQKYLSKNLDYKLSHENYSFEEPIFSWIPSIGVSQIVKIENNFTPFWEDNFLIGSLNFKHLIRVKFDKTYSKLIFTENIFINERIRDLKYSKKYKLILLALEDTGSLGVLNIKD
jgi:hypothetical protein